MTVVLLFTAVAGIMGFLLCVYFFFYRLEINRIWRWLGGIVGGLIMGAFMALAVFLIAWPPVLDFVTAGGIALMAITISTLLTSTKSRKESSMFEAFPVALNGKPTASK